MSKDWKKLKEQIVKEEKAFQMERTKDSEHEGAWSFLEKAGTWSWNKESEGKRRRWVRGHRKPDHRKLCQPLETPWLLY